MCAPNARSARKGCASDSSGSAGTARLGRLSLIKDERGKGAFSSFKGGFDAHDKSKPRDRPGCAVARLSSSQLPTRETQRFIQSNHQSLSPVVRVVTQAARVLSFWEGCGRAGERDEISEMVLANWSNVRENQDALEAQVQGQSQWMQKCGMGNSHVGNSSVKKNQEVTVTLSLSMIRQGHGCLSRNKHEYSLCGT